MLMPHDKLGYKCGLSVTDEILSSDWQTNTKKESVKHGGFLDEGWFVGGGCCVEWVVG